MNNTVTDALPLEDITNDIPRNGKGWKPQEGHGQLEKEHEDVQEMIGNSTAINRKDQDREDISFEDLFSVPMNNIVTDARPLEDIRNGILRNNTAFQSMTMADSIIVEKVTEDVMDFVIEKIGEMRQSFQEEWKVQRKAYQEEMQRLHKKVAILENQLKLKQTAEDLPLDTSLDQSLNSSNTQLGSSVFTDEEVLIAMNAIQPKATRPRLARELNRLKLPNYLLPWWSLVMTSR